ncbi:DF family (seleno)protein [Leifsonia poae]|uniref:DF family (seleno)protein n=1 Tax=Leifsonia poae TaxID=110933 RepID=UPI001CBC9BFB|nr:hypothetical protein [Leifsonia poae]
MKVQLLHIPDCPSWPGAEQRLRAVLERLGVPEPVEVVEIATGEAAAASNFGGSPTILLDGRDPFPGTRSAELACRVYAVEGRMAPMPSEEQIEGAVRAAAE